MKASEMKAMTDTELKNKLAELKDELFHLRFQLAIKQLDNPHKITAVKRDIARVLTVMNEKKVKDAAEEQEKNA